MAIQTLIHACARGNGVVSRRAFLGSIGLGAAAGTLGWKETVALHADEMRKQGMACILLYMRGGPSQLETFDPKPGTGAGGPTKAIQTAVSGIDIANHWNQVAKSMKDFAIIRSMTNKEGEHIRATYQIHTGYLPSTSLKHPSIGALVASELGKESADLPNFVAIANNTTPVGSGFLGMRVAPFVVAKPDKMPSNVELPKGVNDKRYNRRIALLKDLEEDFANGGGGQRVEDHQTLYNKTAKLILSPRLKAFDISQEKNAVAERYGKNAFGEGCLLARRLVEAGVTFVEVDLYGWDTHDDNFNRVKALADMVDPAMVALVSDLKERGLLDKTLVIWMGEFGRTPKISSKKGGGRDHYPKAFNVALAGGGIKGGQVIGSTTPDGAEVKTHPVSVADLLCTFCQALKINPRKENMSGVGRPIKIVDGGVPIKELF